MQDINVFLFFLAKNQNINDFKGEKRKMRENEKTKQDNISYPFFSKKIRQNIL
jgi:hypothetical protein